jgi:hypothetical protein
MREKHYVTGSRGQTMEIITQGVYWDAASLQLHICVPTLMADSPYPLDARPGMFSIAESTAQAVADERPDLPRPAYIVLCNLEDCCRDTAIPNHSVN